MNSKNTVTVDLGEARNTCFVIMPFGSSLDRVYIKVFKKAIVNTRLIPIRADEIYSHRRIISDIWDSIKSTRVILAELTGKNANVLYELGLAHALGKPVIIVTSNLDDVPFDLRDIRCICYDKNQPDWGELLSQDIASTIESILDNGKPLEMLHGIKTNIQYSELPKIPIITDENTNCDVSGEWKLEDKFNEGLSTGLMSLSQETNEIKGSVILTEARDNGRIFIIKESLSGVIKGSEISLAATSFNVIKGETNAYQLDEWHGTFLDKNTIVGTSDDKNNTAGRFKMTRT